VNSEKNHYSCIVTGEKRYIPPSLAKVKISKFGSEDDFRKHFVSPSAAKLLRAGTTVDEIRKQLNITDLPKIPLIILTRLQLLRKKKGQRAQESIKRLERQQYLNSQEFRDKIAAWEKRKENMSFREWVQENTSIGRSRGGTCIRPDVFLSLNDHACNDCPYYEHCMCYQKRLSHEKRKRKQR
jgi:Rad3-related DNA helicase|tara:strand:+ start:228 stop:776 length:549 start_codon:yes stop_codon:yes gene_type:complete